MAVCINSIREAAVYVDSVISPVIFEERNTKSGRICFPFLRRTKPVTRFTRGISLEIESLESLIKFFHFLLYRLSNVIQFDHKIGMECSKVEKENISNTLNIDIFV